MLALTNREFEVERLCKDSIEEVVLANNQLDLSYSDLQSIEGSVLYYQISKRLNSISKNLSNIKANLQQMRR